MADLAALHRRLLLALDLSSVLLLGALAPACDSKDSGATAGKAEASKDGASKDDATKTDATKTDAAKTDATKPDETKTDETKVDVTKVELTKTDPTDETTTKEGTPPEPPPELRYPPCPSGTWCGPLALVEPMRRTDLEEPPPDVGGCPGAIHGDATIDPAKFAGYEGLPLHGGMLANVDAKATNDARAAGKADMCCYDWMTLCPGGRPLLIEGRPWIAPLRPGRSFTAALPDGPAPAWPQTLGPRLAEQWLRDALTEHASIASFARARAELQAIGAPPSLWQACERAAQDEVEHARLCFALAERYGGPAVEPTGLPEVRPRSTDAIGVALDTFVEGCVGETVAAACAREAAQQAVDPIVRAVLERIADDEAEHAALAWRTVAWLARREGPQVLAALRRRAAELRPAAERLPPADPDGVALRAHGRLDARDLAQTRAHAWREIIDPLLARLASPADASSSSHALV